MWVSERCRVYGCSFQLQLVLVNLRGLAAITSLFQPAISAPVLLYDMIVELFLILGMLFHGLKRFDLILLLNLALLVHHLPPMVLFHYLRLGIGNR